MPGLTAEIKQKFQNLACALSPENISCDGELPRAAVEKRYRSLTADWHALERQVGRAVKETEVWSW